MLCPVHNYRQKPPSLRLLSHGIWSRSTHQSSLATGGLPPSPRRKFTFFHGATGSELPPVTPAKVHFFPRCHWQRVTPRHPGESSPYSTVPLENGLASRHPGESRGPEKPAQETISPSPIPSLHCWEDSRTCAVGDLLCRGALLSLSKGVHPYSSPYVPHRAIANPGERTTPRTRYKAGIQWPANRPNRAGRIRSLLAE